MAALFCGRALGARTALLDGAAGLAWVVDGTVKVTWNVYVAAGRVVRIDMHADPDGLATIAAETAETVEPVEPVEPAGAG